MYHGGNGGYGGRPPSQPPPNNRQWHPQHPRPGIGSHMMMNGPPPQQQHMYSYNGPPPPIGPSSDMYPRPMYTGPPPSYPSASGPPPSGPRIPTGPSESSNGQSSIAAHTTVFVGTISAGISDEWITRLLSACGPLRSFKRVNASFGFAEFSDAESVLRALSVLSEKELPVMANNSTTGKEEVPKKLTIKADEKTRKYLDQYEQNRMKTNDHDYHESQALREVERIIIQMADPNNIIEAKDTQSYSVPSHLKDLPPEDLPEEHRGAVLSEIDKFRQASAARDEERKRRERIQEIERTRTYSNRHQGSSADDQHLSREDKQSYLRPVGFVSSSSSQSQERTELPADERDAKEEEERRSREEEVRVRDSQEAERRYLTNERNRLSYWDRELDKQSEIDEKQYQKSIAMKKLAETWDQIREMERDMFYVDRSRWRSLRKPMREREEEEDEADRKLQEEEEEIARIETERFLAQQAEDMAAYEKEQRAAGVLIPTDGVHVPLKLKRAAGASVIEDQNGQTQVNSRILGIADDEGDLSKVKKGKLTHIDLTDEETKRAQIKSGLPIEKEALFAMQPKWDKLVNTTVEENYRSILDKGIIESLGESVPDMVQELIDNILKHVQAKDLIEIVEPVLEEEAAPLIEKLWREILIDTLSADVNK